ncbi:DUF302 domain-containing protein [Rhodoferax ferrireducens]|uniref:DUF302 domain-containing protein n=1 Tax=Rhodoferax ferrireducens TaxID=192843 RepID=UPI000E0D6C5F|nr:DUF302 domain-containing protein [Rhodoferax ferrireducens]
MNPNDKAMALVAESAVTVTHVRISTDKPYASVKKAIESRLGRLSDHVRELLRLGKIEEVRAALTLAAGDAGLAIHYVGPHGDWLLLNGERKEATSYLIGNVLYAVQMTRVDLAAGLYAPLRVVLYASEDGGSVIEYDKPSTLFCQFGREEINTVAAILDQRLSAVLLQACAV